MLPKMRESAQKYSHAPRIMIIGSEGMNFVPFEQRKAEEGAILTTLNDKNMAIMGDRYFLTKMLVMLW